MKTITIEGQLRTETGKKNTRALRSQGLVPGVIYGGSQEVNFAAPVLSFKNLVYTAEFLLAQINVDGKSYRNRRSFFQEQEQGLRPWRVVSEESRY